MPARRGVRAGQRFLAGPYEGDRHAPLPPRRPERASHAWTWEVSRPQDPSLTCGQADLDGVCKNDAARLLPVFDLQIAGRTEFLGRAVIVISGSVAALR